MISPYVFGFGSIPCVKTPFQEVREWTLEDGSKLIRDVRKTKCRSAKGRK